MEPRLYIDVHILQTVPPANLNRDDHGNPKEAYFGGVRRSRVSSQAWKRATRKRFAEHLPEQDLATRTKKIAAKLTERLQQRCGLDEDQASRIAAALLAPLGISAGKKAGDTAYLFFYGRRQLEDVVDLIADRATELAALPDTDLEAQIKDLPVQEKFSTGHPLDVALFGRMVADIPSLNVDAATQVAHALSTHATELEFDYYTAVDDENTREETGAGMIGNIGFNSATLYRYATVGLHQLMDNLSDAAAAVDAADLFVESFARSIPTGYENSFAHRTLPSFVAVVLRADQPVNLVSAFETPITTTTAGIATASAQRLAREHTAAIRMWGDTPLYTAQCHSFDADRDDTATAAVLKEAFGEPLTFTDLRNGLRAQLTTALQQERA
ncbi:type I-E CRISPR-associated protein Cas7/Cse4/CasC [Allostreptomyces psammosilenae]|uniref:CRISPR system Cascade subunit CasC n=1 Tax=Allostreptomyces psammosilenae TaxID=1892865 RepID=A0A852ZYU1_9ACTN|nr:type I-E CRISPR-associated protein Cas7/Cse4/CasC [Allostreptomyces psammosilenae]NYI03452.1 CRISPR system Cascade subunit CasC [Allostreptomyces psammosilenae]